MVQVNAHTNLIVKSTRILTLNENDFGYSANAKMVQWYGILKRLLLRDRENEAIH